MSVQQHIIDKQVSGLANGRLFQGRQEISILSELVSPKERILSIVEGNHEGKKVLLIVTNQRVFLISCVDKAFDVIIFFKNKINKIIHIKDTKTSRLKLITAKETYIISSIDPSLSDSLLKSIESKFVSPLKSIAPQIKSQIARLEKSERVNNTNVNPEFTTACKRKINKRIWITIPIVLLCIAWIGGLWGSGNVIPYRVISQEIYPTNWQQGLKPYKKVYTVEVSRARGRYPTVKQLEAILNRIRNSYPRVNYTHVSFYLPGMQIGNGHWAGASYFEEDNRKYVSIIGIRDQDLAFFEKQTISDGKLIGQWIAETFPVQTIIIYRHDLGHRAKTIYADKSSTIEAVWRYDNVYMTNADISHSNRRQESKTFYRILPDGNLQIEDEQGAIMILSKIR